MLADKARIAANFFSRLQGLLGTTSLPQGEGLLIKPCSAIHMVGMKYAIDALFMDKEMRVVAVVHSIAPGCFSKSYFRARCCLELPAGTLIQTGTCEGDQIRQQEL